MRYVCMRIYTHTCTCTSSHGARAVRAVRFVAQVSPIHTCDLTGAVQFVAQVPATDIGYPRVYGCQQAAFRAGREVCIRISISIHDVDK